ncbi:hypothetical protein I6M42_21945 [Shewanella algae]|uniref:hypothetical protein n=1 Tax=Shewanella algae TaxID=38313 RepID=UPI001AAF0B0A|nr:hypothetical protein [Shewanella algae]MBO2639293.1 hypothetical protein [Shewanella algae]
MSNDKIADLKAKFVAGAIPQESDYAKLLDMLEETRAAAGTSPDAQKSASLRLSDEGYLDVAVAAAADGGIVTGASGLSIDVMVLCARNHAISTGAVKYGIWNGGDVFIYKQTGAGGMKVQFCMKYGWLYEGGTSGIRLFDNQGNVLCETHDRAINEPILGYWTDIAETINMQGEVTDAAKISFKWDSLKSGSDSRPEVVLMLHSL